MVRVSRKPCKVRNHNCRSLVLTFAFWGTSLMSISAAGRATLTKRPRGLPTAELSNTVLERACVGYELASSS